MTTARKGKMPLWKWILFFIAAAILAVMGQVLSLSTNEIANMIGYPGLTIIGVAIVLGLYALFVKLMEKHWPTDLKLKRLIPDTLLGLLVGLVYMAMVVSTIAALGYADVSWSAFSWQGQWKALMLFLAVAVGEELMCRGVLFRLIDERWNMWVALLVSALIFGLGHISNDNSSWWASLAIAIEAGLLLAAAYKWSGTLWLPIGIHWAWNYVQGNIFGLPVSGKMQATIYSSPPSTVPTSSPVAPSAPKPLSSPSSSASSSPSSSSPTAPSPRNNNKTAH